MDYSRLSSIQKYLLLGLIMLFPVYWRLSVPLVVVSFFLVSVFSVKSWWQVIRMPHNHLFLLSYLCLFFVFLFGLTYSGNVQQGLISMEIKMSFVVIPFILLGIQVDFSDQKNKRLFLLFLIAGALISGLIMTGYSLWFSPYKDFSTKILNPKFYHHTYYSLYINIVICFLLYDFRDKQLHLVLRIGLILFFSALIYLSNSRTGIIVLLVLFFIFLVTELFSKKRAFYYYIIALFIFLGSSYFFVLQPSISRTITLIVKSPDRVTLAKAGGMARIDLWTVAVEKIKDKPFLGYGTGASNDALLEGYRERQLNRYADNRFNAHNQFLQTLLDVGFIGFFFLIFLFVVGYVRAFMFHNSLMIMLLTVFFIVFLFESAMNRFMGIFPFVFFPLFVDLFYLKTYKRIL